MSWDPVTRLWKPLSAAGTGPNPNNVIQQIGLQSNTAVATNTDVLMLPVVKNPQSDPNFTSGMVVNLATGEVTAPVAGVYMFIFQEQFTVATAPATAFRAGLSAHVNGALLTRFLTLCALGLTTYTLNGSYFVSAPANGLIQFAFYQESGQTATMIAANTNVTVAYLGVAP